MRPRLRTSLCLAGAGLLAATAAIHLDLYLTGYRSIPTIGWLFLLQVIAAFALAAAVLATAFTRGDGLMPRLVAAAGAGFAVATLGGYLLSLWDRPVRLQGSTHHGRDRRGRDRGSRLRGAGGGRGRARAACRPGGQCRRGGRCGQARGRRQAGSRPRRDARAGGRLDVRVGHPGGAEDGWIRL